MCTSVITSIDQIAPAVQKGFPFEVCKYPLVGPDNMPTPHYGLRRDDLPANDKSAWLPLACKSGFTMHTRDDIEAGVESVFGAFERSGMGGEMLLTCHWRRNGHSVIMGPTKEHRRGIFGTADNLFPRVVLNLPYGQCVTGEGGAYRDACKNLAMPHQIGGHHFKFRHTYSLRANMSEMIEGMSRVVESFETIAARAAEMEETRVNVADFIAQLYPEPETDSKRARTQARNRATAILRRLLNEREATGRADRSNPETATLWEALNAVTGYVQHDKTRHKVRGAEMSRVDRAMAAIDDSETDAAWGLALEMLAA